MKPSPTFPIATPRRGFFATSLLLLTASAASAAVGTWSTVTPAPGSIDTMLLLTDGSVMALESRDNESQNWLRLTPNASGSYASGTWTALAPMHDTRLFFASVVLRDGRVFVAGGEYGTGGSSVEVYDPKTNVWSYVSGYSGPRISDAQPSVMNDGRVLLWPASGSSAWIWDPVTGTWTQTPTKLRGDGNDEESWTHLPDGSFIAASTFTGGTSQRYLPSTNSWADAGSTQVVLVDSEFEIGPGMLLYDGRVLALGASGQTSFYTPGTPGTWQAGPPIPDGFRTDDAPGAVMPNGHVLFAADAGGANVADFTPPTHLYEFDPSARTYASVPVPSSAMTGQGAFLSRMLMLPNGQVMLSHDAPDTYLYQPSGSPSSAWRPTISSFAVNADGTITLTGTQLNGLTEGASYGDDAQMATNFPIVSLNDTHGGLRYARTGAFSTMGVATGSTPVSCQVAATSVPDGSYQLSVIANGIPSATTVPVTVAGGRFVASNGNGLTGSYFATQDLTGPAIQRVDPTINFDWGTGSPMAGIPADHFSVRWTGQIQALTTETYTFKTYSDDGIRVWVNGQEIINDWTDHPLTLDTGTPIALTAGQKVSIVIEYYENAVYATAKLYWQTPTITSQPVPQAQLFPATTTGTGLTGQYWTNQLATFNGAPTLTRIDPTVNFQWGTGSPDPSISVDHFTVRWTGQIQASTTETYTFKTNSDDGIRVWVNGQQIINDWTDHPTTLDTGTPIALTAGQKVPIVIEYYENAVYATAQLYWQTPSIPMQPVPQAQLYPTSP